jgi:hypothetical protein
MLFGDFLYLLEVYISSQVAITDMLENLRPFLDHFVVFYRLIKFSFLIFTYPERIRKGVILAVVDDQCCSFC